MISTPRSDRFPFPGPSATVLELFRDLGLDLLNLSVQLGPGLPRIDTELAIEGGGDVLGAGTKGFAGQPAGREWLVPHFVVAPQRTGAFLVASLIELTTLSAPDRPVKT